MSVATATAPMAEGTTKCKDVEDTAYCSWKIKLYENGGNLCADWSSTTDFEPDYATIVLYHTIPGKDPVRIKTGKREGSHRFSNDFRPGKGFKLALVAKGFNTETAVVVSTRESTGITDFPIEQEATHQYRLALARNPQGRAQLTWGTPGSSNDPSFRPREGKVLLDVKGEDGKEYPINDWSKSLDTGVRWGTGLTARYTAESFGHNPPRIEIVRIQTS